MALADEVFFESFNGATPPSTSSTLNTKAPTGELRGAYVHDLAGRPSSVSDTNGMFAYGYEGGHAA
jgi:hypothetical protein